MIRSAVLRLSLLYLAIVMTISIGFSLLFYRAASNELERELRRPQAIEKIGMPPGTFNFDEFRAVRLSTGRERLRTNLIVLNLLTLFAAGGLSYYAARRTLRPIGKALHAQARFASDASHELRTPLAAMKTEIEVALRDPQLKRSELLELLESNLEEINTLQGLSESLLTLARQSEIKMSLAPVDLTDVFDTAWQRLGNAARQKDITLINQVEPIVLHAHEAALAELLYVLLDNAVKYSPDNGTVSVVGKRQGRHVQVTVADDGSGIPADQIPYIFDRFYRANAARTKNNASTGYGLGLAIADTIARAHNGTIKVSSEVGKGSTFTLNLPLKMEY